MNLSSLCASVYIFFIFVTGLWYLHNLCLFLIPQVVQTTSLVQRTFTIMPTSLCLLCCHHSLSLSVVHVSYVSGYQLIPALKRFISGASFHSNSPLAPTNVFQLPPDKGTYTVHVVMIQTHCRWCANLAEDGAEQKKQRDVVFH